MPNLPGSRHGLWQRAASRSLPWWKGARPWGKLPTPRMRSMTMAVTNIPMTRGLLCCMRRPVLRSVEAVTAGTRRIAVLENVTNPTNVGAIIRSAAALGMEAVLLNHACSDPCYRRAARVSMGTVFQMPWTYLENTETGRGMHYVALLQSLGFKTAALALRKDTVSISDPCLAAEERLAVILGAEGEGLTDETIDRSDYTIRIPMAHGVDSLNVAACSAVAFWELSLYKGQPV